jgi:WD repeat-containing protein 1 (actin-interacting protein 1)
MIMPSIWLTQLGPIGEYPIIAGRINDIAWDGESQRIIAVGDGKERFGHCFNAQAGNSVGEISGHSAQVNSVSIRPCRPLRAVTGSDDMNLVFYHGAPFKFNTSMRGKHERFVYGTAFSPDGNNLVSVGADKKIWLFDGKTGEDKTQIGEGVHTGSIFGVSWASDSKRFATASADQTVRIWDVEAGKAIQTWRMGGDDGVVSIPDQQVGVVWPSGRSDGLIISVDLEGNLNYLVDGNPSPTKVVRGHQKNITAATTSTDAKTLFTGSYEGRVLSWDIASGSASKVDGESHSNYVAGMSSGGDAVQTIGWDDTLRSISPSALTFAGSKTALGFQPKAVTTTTGSGKPTVLVAGANSISLYVDGAQVGTLETKYAPTALAATGNTVAVGADDKVVRLFTLSGTSLQDTGVELRRATAPISSLAFSPNGTRLAAGVANGKIFVFAQKAGATEWSVETDRWSAHTARVTCVAWDSSGEFAVSGGLDTNVFVWSVKNPGKRIKALNAHKEGVNGVAWVGADKVMSAGGDAAVKVWKLAGLD